MHFIFQANNSNHNQVSIKNVKFDLTGNFSCEALGDGPRFHTESSSHQLLQVVCKYIQLSLLIHKRFEIYN